MFKNIKDWFNFSKKELNGILVLCVLIFFVIIIPPVYSKIFLPEDEDFSAFDKEISKFYASETTLSDGYSSYKNLKDEIEEKELVTEYFSFNPNGLPVESWKRLGLTSRQIQVIKNYESKGGKFFKKDDLKKIYSISTQDYARLEPYIEIPNAYPQKRVEVKSTTSSKRSSFLSVKVVEINSADSSQLESLRGIGPAFASRIVRYRTRLGGFHSKEQLREVYGIDSLMFAAIKDQISVDDMAIQKININTAVFEDLKRHPYLSYKQMNAILKYRSQHGRFSSMNDMQKIVILNDEILRKIEPYITF
ncbi:MAG TPA: helix-hairpin-helix domain-containing protein [Sphingobacteriaceae bacterium]